MLKSFVVSWLIYWGLALVLPVHSIYPAVLEALGLQIVFVLLVSLGYLAVTTGLSRPRMPTVQTAPIPTARRVARLAGILSLMGLVFLVYDKIAIQGIDYSDGLAVAREQWREIGEEREGRASSAWSALGYLVGSAYFVMLVVVLVQPQQFRNGERLAYTGLAFLFALVNSVITGGRSSFMLLVVFAISAMSVRRGLSIASIFPRRQHRRMILGIALATVFYLIYVFYARASVGGDLVAMYVVNFLPYMGLEFDDWYLGLSQVPWIASIGNILILAIGYLTHSLATFAAIVDAPPESKIMLFGNVAELLYKVDFIEMPQRDWFLSGRFPSVPGALWHQWGLVGFLLGSLLLGLAAGLSAQWAAHARRRLVPIGLYTMAGATLLLTPYVFAPDLLSFPFVFTAFLLLAVVVRSKRRSRRRGRPTSPSTPGGSPSLQAPTP